MYPDVEMLSHREQPKETHLKCRSLQRIVTNINMKLHRQHRKLPPLEGQNTGKNPKLQKSHQNRNVIFFITTALCNLRPWHF